MNSKDKNGRPISEVEAERRRQQRLLSRDEIEEEYGLSRRWLELSALRGDGPAMTKISRRMVRYRCGTFEDWLAARTVRCPTSTPLGQIGVIEQGMISGSS